MFPNPGPLNKAMGKPESLPGFLFSNPVVAGFFAMIILPVFGVAAAIFFAQLNTGTGSFDAARAGAIVAVLLGALIYGAITVSAVFLSEERAARLLFVLGGMIGIGVLIAFDVYVADYLRDVFFEGQ